MFVAAVIVTPALFPRVADRSTLIACEPDPPRLIFEHVIEKPTGRNGYEGYCAAADLGRLGPAGDLNLAWVSRAPGNASGLCSRTLLRDSPTRRGPAPYTNAQ